MRRFGLVQLLVYILFVTVAVYSCSKKDPVAPSPKPQNPTWKVVTGPTQVDLVDIWGSGPDDVFAVGDQGAVIHYDGNGWSVMPSPVSTNLLGVWGSGPDNVYAVGVSETVIHYNGVGWTHNLFGDIDDFNDIWGWSASEIFITTCTGNVRFFDGMSWRPMSTGSQWCTAIWGPSSDFVYAVGDGYFFYDHSVWEGDPQVGSPPLWDVFGTAESDITAVGGGGAIRHFDGFGWSSRDSHTIIDLYGTWSHLWNDVYAVGDEGKILRYDGNDWSSLPALTTEKLNAVWGSSGTNVWVVGDKGTIIHYGI